MGGPMGVQEYDKYPFLAAECSFIAEMVRRKRPVLGIAWGLNCWRGYLGQEFSRATAGSRLGLVKLTAESNGDPLPGQRVRRTPHSTGMEILSTCRKEQPCSPPAQTTEPVRSCELGNCSQAPLC